MEHSLEDQDQDQGLASEAMAFEFEKLVRDALHHMYDLSHLQNHPLSKVLNGDERGGIPAGRLTRQALLDAIEAINPGQGAGVTSRAWRSYRILELRFIEELEIGDVIRQIALSKSQYHRAQNRAINAVASYLWQRFNVDQRQTGVSAQVPPPKPSVSEPGGPIAKANGIRIQLQGFAQPDTAPDLDFLEVLWQVIDLLAPLEKQHAVQISIRTDGTSPIIRGGRVVLRQALLPILSRAVASSSPGRIDVAVRRLDSEVEMVVSGESDETVTDTRLGLEDCRPFVETLGGTVLFMPTDDVGCEWSVSMRFPAIHAPLLLIVDNDSGFVDLIRRYLSEQEWEIIGMPTADEALAAARAREPAAILLDLILPDRDGWDLLMDLRRDPMAKEVPVIVCSALDERDIANSLGASGYLRKPVSQADIIMALARVRRDQKRLAR